MPTIFREKGYRFSFYSYDLGEPMHVHVTKDGAEAKVWMSPLVLAWSKKYRDHEIRELLDIVAANRAVIESAWNERRGN
jgi:ribosome-binding factor A